MVKSRGRVISGLESVKQNLNWYANLVRTMNSRDTKLFKSYATPEIGNMYLYMYDPKHKATLPVYDVFPLVFPIEEYSDGFLGINMHYLPPVARARLLDALMVLANNDKLDKTTKLEISYNTLANASNMFKGYNNCVKRYLFSQMRSSFHLIYPTDWPKVTMLPLQRFVGKAPY
jgi:hypothetical protein